MSLRLTSHISIITSDDKIMSRRLLFAVLPVAFLFPLAGCSESVTDDPNGYGFETGPNMQPGDNCRACHGAPSSRYPEAPAWSVAGTVYEGPDSDVGASGIEVEITDAAGKRVTLTTNSVGNFYTGESFTNPLLVALVKGGVRVEMPAPPPSGGCNGCHDAPPTGDAPGRLYFPESGAYESLATCPTDRPGTLEVGNTTYDCGGYLCDDSAEPARCLTECMTSDDCAEGVTCVDERCEDTE
jgi:hypothetical protein